MHIKVIDAMMGSGKTTAMLNFINESPPEKKFIFVTPFLDEGNRIKAYCPERDFRSPEAFDGESDIVSKPRSKLIDFKQFLREKQNIVTTHALFERFDDEALSLISSAGYTLIMDEVADVISLFDISLHDTRILLRNCMDQQEDGRLIWNREDRHYYGRYLDYKELCDKGWLWYYNDQAIIKMMPPSLFTAFSDVYLMTYLFDAQFQRAYFDMFDIPYERIYVSGNSPDTYHITKEIVDAPKADIRDKIHICREKKLNRPYDAFHSLSSGWFQRYSGKEEVNQLKNNIYNFFRHYCGAKSRNALWTVYREKDINKTPGGSSKNPPYITPRGYGSCFLACNSRATNVYRDRTVCAYPLNRFPSPQVLGFLARYDIHLDRDRWALSEMIQWIWRSAIRDGKDIYIYVPSRRMRELLEQWIKEVSNPSTPAGVA
jgi:hypothetical protein